MTATLKFDAEGVARLMAHAHGSKEWSRGFMDESEPRPQLAWVKDSGIYLMSNGLPGLPLGGEAEEGGNVVYARGYDPRRGDVWEKCRRAVGGDDFVEYIDLAELGPMPARALALVLRVSPTTFSIGWELGEEPPCNRPQVMQDDKDPTQQRGETMGTGTGKPAPKTTANEVGKGTASRIAAEQRDKHTAAVERAKNPEKKEQEPHSPDASLAEVLELSAAKKAAEQQEQPEAQPPTMTDEQIEAMDVVERINAASVEYEALSAWTKGGKQGPQPPTPIRDWGKRRDEAEAQGASEKGEGTVPSKSSTKESNKTRVSASAPQTVRFTVDGKPVGDTQNRLSSVARVTATATEPRWPAPQFRDWIVQQGVADPLRTEWELTLPNGRVVGAKFDSPVAAAQAQEENGSAPAKTAPVKKAAPAKEATAKKAAPAKAAAPAKKAPAKTAATAKKAPAKTAPAAK